MHIIIQDLYELVNGDNLPGKDRERAKTLADMEKLRKLQKENEELRKENDFLKKAAAFFTKESR